MRSPTEMEKKRKSERSSRSRKGRRASQKLIRIRVLLLDDTFQEYRIEPKAPGDVLFQLICDEINLWERDFFGLRYQDREEQLYWLDLNEPIKKQLKVSPNLVCYFCVKHYAADPCSLHEELTRYQFFLQVKRDILYGRVLVSHATAVHLFACAVQSELGDYSAEDMDDDYVSEFLFLPEECQTAELEKEVAKSHKKLSGLVPSQAEMSFLERAKWLPLYGVDLHPVKGLAGTDLQVGVSYSGLSIFQNAARVGFFHWPKIRKIQFKRNIFSLQVTVGQPNLAAVETLKYKFVAASERSAKELWKCCVEQHCFFRRLVIHPDEEIGGGLLRSSSSFRYSGRTEFQLRQSTQNLQREEPSFERAPSRRSQRSLPAELEFPRSASIHWPSLRKAASSLSQDLSELSPLRRTGNIRLASFSNSFRKTSISPDTLISSPPPSRTKSMPPAWIHGINDRKQKDSRAGDSSKLKTANWFVPPQKVPEKAEHDGVDQENMTAKITKCNSSKKSLKSAPVSGYHSPTGKVKRLAVSVTYPRTPQSSDLSMSASPTLSPKSQDWPWYSAILAESEAQGTSTVTSTTYLPSEPETADSEEEHLRFLQDLWHQSGLDNVGEAPPFQFARSRGTAESERIRRYGMHSVFLDKMSGLGENSDSRRELLVDGYARPQQAPAPNSEAFLPGIVNSQDRSEGSSGLVTARSSTPLCTRREPRRYNSAVGVPLFTRNSDMSSDGEPYLTVQVDPQQTNLRPGYEYQEEMEARADYHNQRRVEPLGHQQCYHQRSDPPSHQESYHHNSNPSDRRQLYHDEHRMEVAGHQSPYQQRASHQVSYQQRAAKLPLHQQANGDVMKRRAHSMVSHRHRLGSAGEDSTSAEGNEELSHSPRSSALLSHKRTSRSSQHQLITPADVISDFNYSPRRASDDRWFRQAENEY